MTLDDIFARSIPEPNSGCWLWEGKTLNVGYPRMCVNGRDHLIHRLVCELVTGQPIPPKMYACHKCNVRLCVNPDHLYVGTFHDNMRDMAAAGTQKGERNPSAVLKAADVIRIRADNREMKHIAGEYGVHRGTIQAIKSGRSWAHLEG
jgi:hypothetical protein